MKFLFIALLVFAFPVSAQTVVVEECKAITGHIPADDVNYKPGVDVSGKPVVPADLNAAPFVVPDILMIPLSVDLARRLPDPPDGVLGEAPLGFLEVHKNGRITYEGQDWTSQIYAVCQDRSLPEITPQDGQILLESVQSSPVIETPVEEAK